MQVYPRMNVPSGRGIRLHASALRARRETCQVSFPAVSSNVLPIARALAGNPSVILADEPTGALDSRTSREVLDFLQKLNDEGNTIVLITHDNSIAQEAKRVIRVADGKIIFDGPAREAFPRGD